MIKDEIKLIILYIVKNVKKSVDYTLLDFVISSVTNVNYFELEPYIAELIEKDNLMEYQSDGKIFFSIKDSGEETLDFFKHKIPGSIMSGLVETITDINRTEARGNSFFVDYIPLNSKEYAVTFSMVEGGLPLVNMEFYAGSKERAAIICNYLKNNTAEFYKSLTGIIDDGTK